MSIEEVPKSERGELTARVAILYVLSVERGALKSSTKKWLPRRETTGTDETERTRRRTNDGFVCLLGGFCCLIFLVRFMRESARKKV